MVNITHSNRTSYHPRRYNIDEYGIQTSALPPYIRALIQELQTIDEQQANKRTELNKAAERWMQDAGMSFFFDLDEPTGPIAFTKRQGYKPEQEQENPRLTKVVHTRVKGTVTRIIDNIIKITSNPEPKPKPKPQRGITLVIDPKHRVAAGYDQRTVVTSTLPKATKSNPYGI